MSQNGHPVSVKSPEELDTVTTAEQTDTMLDRLRRAVKAVMTVSDITYHYEDTPIRVRGQLNIPAEEAFANLRPQFEEVGHTPKLRREDGFDVITALPAVFNKKDRGIPWGPIISFAVTLVIVFFVGMGKADGLYIPPVLVIAAHITGNAEIAQYPELLPSAEVWRAAFLTGLVYTVSLLGILGAHEMGHYIMAKRYNVDTTPPFFIPFPNVLGTLGAVIAMREPSPNRKIQFDIGIAGPLAGLIVAVPVLLVGLMLSEVGTPETILTDLPPQLQENTVILQEGQSLAYLAAKYAVFGRILPSAGEDVWIHPVAFAGWAGLLVTALNLLPIGQLDGGHIIYGIFGDGAAKARWPIIGVLIVLAGAGALTDAGIVNLPFGWSGWWLWILLLLFLVRGHAPVLDEITGLDQKRKILGVIMLIVFILIFTPRPLVIMPLNFIGLF